MPVMSLYGTSSSVDGAEVDCNTDLRIATSRFEYIEELGSGGFGTVWKVHDRWLGQDLALKLSRASMQQEVSVLRSLPRGLYMNTFDYIRENEIHGYLMELIQHPWMTLADFPYAISKIVSPPRKPAQLLEIKGIKAALQIIAQLLEALGHLHGQRYERRNRWCHGDVKPLNIWVRSDVLAANIQRWGCVTRPFVKLGDLGLVTEKAGTFLGLTPGYAAPEQSKVGKASPGSDVFAVAQTLMYLISGSTLTEWELASKARIVERMAGVPSQYLSRQIADLVREMTYATPATRLTAPQAADRASQILPDDREWMAFETFAAIEKNGLSLSDAADTLFKRFAQWEGWTYKTNARLLTIKELLKDMYQSKKLVRNGRRYFL